MESRNDEDKSRSRVKDEVIKERRKRRNAKKISKGSYWRD